MRLIHTPMCSKARTALSLLTDAGYQPDLIEYREEEVLTRELLQEIEAKTGQPLIDLLRKGDEDYAEASALEGDELRDFVTAHPILLERPILIVGDSAVVARPPERVWELVSQDGPASTNA